MANKMTTTTWAFNWLALLFVFAGTCFQKTNAQAPCNLPNNRPGTCVILDQCPLIRGILINAPKPLPDAVAKYIRSVHCGKVNNMNAVCCMDPIQATTPVVVTTRPADSSTPIDVTNHRNVGLLPSTNCGPLSTDKVSGGNKTNLYEFPWMALLRYNTPEGLDYKCGGSIINDRYILTAAHCISGLRTGYGIYSVILGEYDTTTEVDCVVTNGQSNCLPPRQEFFIDQLIVHPQYNNPKFANDIGLIRLSQRISFTDHITPVCLPKNWALQNFLLKNLVITGWGTTEDNRPSPVLLQAKLSVVGINECQAVHKRVELTNNQICAKGPGIVDSCQGDSGGPLVFPSVLNGSPKYIQYAIVSAGGAGCGNGDAKPGVYVRIQNYMNWILDNIRN